MLPGVVGVLQANEALKIIVGYGEPLVGRFLTFDAQGTRFGELKVRRDPACITCGSGAASAPAGNGQASRSEVLLPAAASASGGAACSA